ncbi:hypothetical protein [Tolypothrix sp. VBCCA 56010]
MFSCHNRSRTSFHKSAKLDKITQAIAQDAEQLAGNCFWLNKRHSRK